ncbi:MAG: hypothetical protein R3F40_00990 [Candidatus Competibacteraceae bacterium]
MSLVAILDADKEGFLRSDRSLISTIGRAARNLRGKAILYADQITGSMRRALDETERRRTKQQTYNQTHGITPRGIEKAVADIMEGAYSHPGAAAGDAIRQGRRGDGSLRPRNAGAADEEDQATGTGDTATPAI